MAIRVSCPCGRTLNLADELRGKKVRCPECSAAITVPITAANPLPTRAEPRSPQSPDTPRRTRRLNDDSRQPPSRSKRPEPKPKASSPPKKLPNRSDQRRAAPHPASSSDYDDVEWLDEADSASWNELPYEAAPVPGRSTQGSNTRRHRGGAARASGKSGMSTTIKVLLIVGILCILPFVLAIGFAVFLPAVQQARVAARESQSRNNLKQIALALHNFHDSYLSFPAGTHSDEKLTSEERLSWMATILPFLNQANLYESINFKVAWNDETNRRAAATRVPEYLNPLNATKKAGPAEAHYVGIAGLGNDAPMLPVTSNRAGIFGIDRTTKISDIKDGTSNTMMISEASDRLGPWVSGGHATMRALTTKPYINGPDGIGGPLKGQVAVAMADGSVRFISEDIDPVTFERLSTMADGQLIGEF
ncbi:MAG: DUF1559 domain-containing protein [Planctomycetaceae bacterium]